MPARRGFSLCQSSQLSDNKPRKLAWTDKQTIELMRFLVEAKKNGSLYGRKTNRIKVVLEDAHVHLLEMFPEREFTFKSVESRYNWLKALKKAFDAAHTSGSSPDPISGKLVDPTPENRANLLRRHKKAGPRILNDGLFIGDGITVEDYLEVFAQEKPSLQYVRPLTRSTTSQESADEETQQLTDNESVNNGSIEEPIDQLVGIHLPTIEPIGSSIELDDAVWDDPIPTQQSIHASIGDDTEMATPTPSSQLIADAEISASAISSPISTAGSRSRSSSSVPIENGEARRSGRNSVGSLTPSLARRGISKNPVRRLLATSSKNGKRGELDAQLMSTLMSLDSQEKTVNMRETSKSEEDFEVAVKGCIEYSSVVGMASAMRIIEWLKKDQRNSIIWNSLKTDDARRQWYNFTYANDPGF